MIDRFGGEYKFLSNFYPVLVTFEGDTYPSVEHAYQAAKTNVPSERQKIRQAPNARIAKRFGRKITLRRNWEQIRLGVMEDLLRQKFNTSSLQILLLNTGKEKLVEGNWWGDTFWGVHNNHGNNHLGKLLMKIRKEIQSAEKGVDV